MNLHKQFVAGTVRREGILKRKRVDISPGEAWSRKCDDPVYLLSFQELRDFSDIDCDPYFSYLHIGES